MNNTEKLLELNKIPLNPTREKYKHCKFFTPSVIPDEVKINVFTPILEKIENYYIRDYCETMITMIPDYIFFIPSASTLKYHNAKQCERCGQLYHILMVGDLLEEIFDSIDVDPMFDMVFNSVTKDLMRCAVIFHDAFKKDIIEQEYSVHNHPLIAQEFILTIIPENRLKQVDMTMLSMICASHSGKWTVSKYSKDVLPIPKTTDEIFFHLADYLGSRKQYNMEYLPETYDAIHDVKYYYHQYLEMKDKIKEILDSDKIAQNQENQ